jgi:hypothetical protein
MLNARSIALQGIGFGVVAFALQGFLGVEAPVAVNPVQDTNGAYGVGPLSKFTEVKQKVRGRAKLGLPQVRALHPVLSAYGKATYSFTLDSTTPSTPRFIGYGKAKVNYVLASKTASYPAFSGKGLHGVSDSDMAAILLLLLDL